MSNDRQKDERRHWLGVLARAPRERLAAALQGRGEGIRVLRPAETGLVMLRGRAGGTGERFNMGEMTVSRCTVADEAGRLGIGMVAGRDRAKAELVARLDLLMQDPEEAPILARELIAPLSLEQAGEQAARAARAAATRVEFFTMVRGDV